jgi:hypothetical protein
MRSSCDPYKIAFASVSNPNAVPGHTVGRARPVTSPARRTGTDASMLDIAFIAAGLAFFGLAAGYATLCERL